jgi:hypothetical protein
MRGDICCSLRNGSFLFFSPLLALGFVPFLRYLGRASRSGGDMRVGVPEIGAQGEVRVGFISWFGLGYGGAGSR